MTAPTAAVGSTTGRFAWMRMGVAVAALAGGGSALATAFGVGVAAALMVSLLSVAGVGIGYVMGRRDGPTPQAIRLLLFRVSDELAQYRAFTRLLRDQGDRITESTNGAAMEIVSGLRAMDAKLERMRSLVDQTASENAHELRSLVDGIGAPIVNMLGQLQFQDVTQQQIGFLVRLSLIVDQHMIDLAQRLGDRRSMDRIENFKEMFNKALDDCVMTSQRDDHHAAVGLDHREPCGPKIELF